MRNTHVHNKIIKKVSCLLNRQAGISIENLKQ